MEMPDIETNSIAEVSPPPLSPKNPIISVFFTTAQPAGLAFGRRVVPGTLEKEVFIGGYRIPEADFLRAVDDLFSQDNEDNNTDDNEGS